jgi:hypothetical protein
MKGSTAIEKDVLLVLGIASNGPIVIYIRKVKSAENQGEIVSPKLFSPFLLTITFIPIIGSKIDVTAKPINAVVKLPLLSKPTNDGNIKFPAPKNIANNVMPKIMVLLLLLFDKRLTSLELPYNNSYPLVIKDALEILL